jgi:very-short-patch-repair endonuclease
MAAVLACGKAAVLSHRSAAMHWGMLTPRGAAVDVTVPGSGGRSRRKGIRVHRATSLTPKDATTPRGHSDELERRFLRLCKRAGLPAPEVNVRFGPCEVDFLWRDHRLIVETDGWETHQTRAAFELDRLRDAEFKAKGYELVRFTYWRVTDDPDRLAQVINQVLRQRASPRQT